MTALTTHFSQEELGVLGCEERLLSNAKFLCETLLEPIRIHFGVPVTVHDGFRPPDHNARVGGKPTSYHLFTDGHAAADFHINGLGLDPIFDWIRLESALPFDKVILEKTAGVPACIHIQADRSEQPRRQAFVGGTGNSQNYTRVEVKDAALVKSIFLDPNSTRSDG